MEQKKFLKLNDIEAYKVAFHLSNYVWNIVIKWAHFEKSTVGESKLRNLLSELEYDHLFAELQKLPKAINSLVAFTNQKLKL